MFKVGDHVKTTKEWHREPFSGTVVWCLFPDVVVENKCGTEVFHFSDLEYDTCSDIKVGMKYILADTYNIIKYLERENRDLQDKINNYEHSVKIGLDTCSLAFILGLGIGMFIIYVIMNL